MKKLRKLSFVIVVPVVVGIGLIIAGMVTDNGAFTTAGLITLFGVTPACMVILIIVALILIMMGKIDFHSARMEEERYYDDEPESNTMDGEAFRADGGENFGAQAEREAIDDINSSRGYESQIKSGEFHARHVVNNFRHSTKKEKILGFLLVVFLLGDAALLVVFGLNEMFVGAIVCFCVFAGTIIALLIGKTVLEKRSKNGGKALDGAEPINAVVNFCVFSSSASVGGVSSPAATRINRVTYRVSLRADDGNEYTAYTDNFYEEGESVKIVPVGRKLASIVEES